MSVRTKKPLTKRKKSSDGYILVQHGRSWYKFPKKIAKRYQVKEEDELISSDSVFASVNNKYTKVGALLRGIRVRENLTQTAMAKRIKVTQSDISQMESGRRNIGREIAKRIEKQFDIDYREFLA